MLRTKKPYFIIIAKNQRVVYSHVKKQTLHWEYITTMISILIPIYFFPELRNQRMPKSSLSSMDNIVHCWPCKKI